MKLAVRGSIVVLVGLQTVYTKHVHTMCVPHESSVGWDMCDPPHIVKTCCTTGGCICIVHVRVHVYCTHTDRKVVEVMGSESSISLTFAIWDLVLVSDCYLSIIL